MKENEFDRICFCDAKLGKIHLCLLKSQRFKTSDGTFLTKLKTRLQSDGVWICARLSLSCCFVWLPAGSERFSCRCRPASWQTDQTDSTAPASACRSGGIYICIFTCIWYRNQIQACFCVCVCVSTTRRVRRACERLEGFRPQKPHSSRLYKLQLKKKRLKKRSQMKKEMQYVWTWRFKVS